MSSRRSVATARDADRTLMLRDLLSIKQRRETSLRRQIAQQNSQLRQLEQDMCRCSASRALLAEKRYAWLAWSGTRMSDELLEYKQTLMKLHEDDQQWIARQQTLSDEQCAIVASQNGVREALHIVMKKKEKLYSLLNDGGDAR